MGYIKVTWVSQVPNARSMSWGNSIFLGSGAVPDGSSNPQLITANNYQQYIPSDRYERVALASYFKNFPGTPTNQTYIYWMGGGNDVTGALERNSDDYDDFKLKYGPFNTTGVCQVDPTGAGNWQNIAASGVLCPSGAHWISGLMANSYSGKIVFDSAGPYFDSGGTYYSGQKARDILAASGGVLRAMAKQNGFGAAALNLRSLDAQFVCPVYNVADTTGLISNKSFEDLQGALDMVAGKRQIVVWSLPKVAAPNTQYSGTNKDYNNFRDYIGQNQNAIVIYADVTTGSAFPNDDPGAALLGRICSAHPKQSMMLNSITLSLDTRENESDKLAWDQGQIICVFRNTDFGFSTDQLNYSFTFSGTTPSDRIENVRCRYLVEYNVIQDLYKLLSGPNKPTVSKSGLNRIINSISATLNRLEKQGIIDPPEKRYVRIPLLESGTDEEWTQANIDGKVPSVLVRWDWKKVVEEINITQFGELL